jgi:hypothetical protein
MEKNPSLRRDVYLSSSLPLRFGWHSGPKLLETVCEDEAAMQERLDDCHHRLQFRRPRCHPRCAAAPPASTRISSVARSSKLTLPKSRNLSSFAAKNKVGSIPRSSEDRSKAVRAPIAASARRPLQFVARPCMGFAPPFPIRRTKSRVGSRLDCSRSIPVSFPYLMTIPATRRQSNGRHVCI